MLKQILLTTGVALMLTPAAVAENDYRASVAYSSYSTDDGDIGALLARGTAFFTENLGVEGELGFGVNDADVETGITGVDASFGLGLSYGVYGVAKTNLGEQFEAFARLGYVIIEVESEASGFGVTSSSSESENGFGIGIGGTFNINENIGIRADITSIQSTEDDVDGSVEVFSLGLAYKF